MNKKAFIIGITGQTGSHLAELLLSKGYEVHGLIRRSSTFSTERVEHLYVDPRDNNFKFFMHYGDLADGSGLTELMLKINPDEVYNLGAQSHVRVSFDLPVYTTDIDALGVLRVLEAIRSTERIKNKRIRFYQASSSEMFGKVQETPQKETTPFYPRSPYGCAKVYGFWQTVNYRESYDMFACNGILFNHEGPRRGETFVTRKITRAATRIKLGTQKKLYMGNLEAKRDWGYAPDFCEGIHAMLQQDKPDDYVLATGELHSVSEFLDEAFSLLDLDWKDYVEEDSKYMRPAEVDLLVGDYSKAKKVLGWEPKVKFKDLVRIMIEKDYSLAMKEKMSSDRLEIEAKSSIQEKLTR